MPSVRARAARLAIRIFFRRRDWGPPAALTRRARRLFGAPSPYRLFRSFGVEVDPVDTDQVRGEWLTPRGAASVTVLYLHGGGYVACSPGTHRPMTAALARLVPARVFALDYRLAPEHPFPAALDDSIRAYRWLLAGGIDPARLVVAGDSAGGGLTLALLIRLRDEGIQTPAGSVLFSPWTDLAGTGESVRRNDGRCDLFRPENISAFASCYAPPDAWHDPLVSPVYDSLERLPPLHIQVGADELLLDDATRVERQVRARGGTAELVVYDGVFHGWHLLDGWLPESRSALDRAARFISRVAAGPDSTDIAR